MAIDFIPTGAWELIKQPQYVEETTFGTLDLADNNWVNIGIVTEIGMDVTVEEDVVRILGSRDVYDQLKLGLEYASAVRFRPQGTKFMRYGSELASRTPVPDNTMIAPNKTNFASLSIIMSAYIDDTEQYRTYLGTKTSTMAPTISRSGGIEVTQNFLHKSISDWIAEPAFTNNDYAGAITGSPWTGISSGEDPFTITEGVTPYTIQVENFNTNWDQGLGQLKPTGIESVYYLAPTLRNITFDFQTWLKGNQNIGWVKNHTALAMEYLMNAGATQDLTNCKVNTYSSNFAQGNEFTTESISGIAAHGTISEV